MANATITVETSTVHDVRIDLSAVLHQVNISDGDQVRVTFYSDRGGRDTNPITLSYSALVRLLEGSAR